MTNNIECHITIASDTLISGYKVSSIFFQFIRLAFALWCFCYKVFVLFRLENIVPMHVLNFHSINYTSWEP